MKRTITKRLIINFGMLIFISFLVISIFSRIALDSFLERQVENEFVEEMKIMSSVIREEFLEVDKESQEKLVTQYTEALKDGQRRLAYLKLDSEMEFIVWNNTEIRHLTREPGYDESFYKLIKAHLLNRDTNQVLSVDNEHTGKTYYVYISALQVLNNTEKNFTRQRVFAISVLDKSNISSLLNQFTRGLLIIMSIVFILTVLILVILSRRLTKPIVQLKTMAQNIGNRKKVKNLVIHTQDELQDLGEAMNLMALKLEQNQEEQLRYLQNASHELKTPLTSIRGYAEGIIDGVIDDHDEALQIIIDESIRLKKIVNGLSLLSKLETGAKTLKLEPINIKQAINDAITKIEPIANSQEISVERVEDIGELLVSGDYDSLIQCFINLLSNGIRYAKSTVAIELDEVNIKELKTNGSTYNSRDKKQALMYIRIRIVDDGEGIATKDLNHVFERFFKGSGGQTGLGLAITKALIERHYGYIQVYNGALNGAIFEVILPKYIGQND